MSMLASLRLPFVMLVAFVLTYTPPRSPPEPDPGTLDSPDDPLPPGAVARIGTIRLRSHLDIDRVAISPDAKLLVTIDNGLRVWDGRTGLPLRTIPMVQFKEEPRYRGDDRERMVPEGVAAMAFTAKTGKFHVLTWNGLLRACNLNDGTWSEPIVRVTLPKNRDPWQEQHGARGLASSDGTHFAYLTLAKQHGREAIRAEVLRIDRNEPVFALEGKQVGAWHVRGFSEDNKLIGVAQNGAAAHICWDLHESGPTTTLTLPGAEFRPLTFALSPDRRSLTVVYAPHTGQWRDRIDPRDDWPLYVYDMATGKEKYRVEKWKGYVAGYIHDGTRLLGIDNDAVIIADAATGKVIHRLKGHATAWIEGTAICANRTYLATCGGRDRSIIVWNLMTGKAALDIDAPRGPVDTIVFSPDGKSIFTSTTQESAGWLWDAQTGTRKQRFIADGHGRPQTAAFTPDGKHVVAGYGYGQTSGHRKGFVARLWRASDGELVREFGNHTDGVKAVMLSPDGKYLATTSRSDDDGVFLWETDTGKRVREAMLVPHRSSVSLAFPKDGELIGLVTSGLTGHKETVNLWTGKFLGAWKTPHPADVHALSPDGRTVVMRERSEKLGRDLFVLRSVKTGAELRRLPIPEFDNWWPVAFSLNGKVVAVAEQNYGHKGGVVYLYDVDTGRHLRTIAGHTGRITALAFSPDGTRLATGSTDTTVLIWDLTTKP